MRAYLVRRTLLGLLTIFLVSLFIFVILRVVPGDVVTLIMGEAEGPVGAATGAYAQRLERLRQELGLADPVQVQFAKWLWDLVRLEPGTSFTTMRPVMTLVKEAYPVTIQLTIVAFTLTIALALVVGILSALRQDSWLDYALRVFTIGGLSMPNFWVGTLLILGLAIGIGYMPPPGYIPPTEDFWASAQQFTLPGLVLAWRSSAILGRMIRSSMLEVLREDYVRTAWAKGLAQSTIVVRHMLKNAALPVVTIMGFQLATLFSGTTVIEVVFGLPGVGRLLVESIRGRDYPTIQFLVMVFAVVVVFVNIAVDILYAWLDPRVAYR